MKFLSKLRKTLGVITLAVSAFIYGFLKGLFLIFLYTAAQGLFYIINVLFAVLTLLLTGGKGVQTYYENLPWNKPYRPNDGKGNTGIL